MTDFPMLVCMIRAGFEIQDCYSPLLEVGNLCAGDASVIHFISSPAARRYHLLCSGSSWMRDQTK